MLEVRFTPTSTSTVEHESWLYSKRARPNRNQRLDQFGHPSWVFCVELTESYRSKLMAQFYNVKFL